jgi:hypothetical protein
MPRKLQTKGRREGAARLLIAIEVDKAALPLLFTREILALVGAAVLVRLNKAAETLRAGMRMRVLKGIKGV